MYRHFKGYKGQSILILYIIANWGCPLQSTSTLQVIEAFNFLNNRFSEMGGVALGPAIGENSSIKELNLSWNSLRRKGAIAVAQGVKVHIFKLLNDIFTNPTILLLN